MSFISWKEIFETLFTRVISNSHWYNIIPWKEMSSHPLLEFRFVEKNIPFIKYLYLHPNFPPDLIVSLENPDWAYFSRTCDTHFILNTLETTQYKWIFRHVCQNPSLTPSMFENDIVPFLSHDVLVSVLGGSLLFQNPAFSFETLASPPYNLRNVEVLCSHPRFSEKWFDLIPLKRWNEFDWTVLSRHPNISMSFIRRTFNDFPWCIQSLSYHPYLDTNFVREQKKEAWDWDGVSLHMSLPDILKYVHRFPLRFRALSKNTCIKPWLVRQYLDKKWDMTQLAINPACPPREIFKDPILFPLWKWEHVCQNPSLDPHTFLELQTQLSLRLQMKLFKNHLFLDKRFLMMQRRRIQKAILLYMRKKHMRRRMRFISFVFHKIGRDCWSHVRDYI